MPAQRPRFKTSGRFAVLKAGQFRPEHFSYEPNKVDEKTTNFKVYFRKLPELEQVRLGNFQLARISSEEVTLQTFLPLKLADARALAKEKRRVSHLDENEAEAMLKRRMEDFKNAMYRKGTGSIVLRAAEDKAREMGAKELTAHPLKEARGFYLRNGYEPIEQYKVRKRLV